MSTDSFNCLLELLNINKPLKESCFSDQQIDMLFNLWREFMYEKFQKGESSQQAREDIDKLYSNSTSVRRKYTALRLDQASSYDDKGLPAISEHETSWVMGETSPTPFIKFLRQRPQVMEILRMSFKPNLLHSGMMEAPDIISLLMRYIYWLKDDKERSLNVIGVTDESAPSSLSLENMLNNLRNKWSTARFHVAMLNESTHWRAVLIDRKSHTFEYYDPLGHAIEIAEPKTPLAEQIRKLYELSRELDPELVTKSMHTTNRGFHKHQTEGTECGMYVVLFLHSRVAHLKTFEQFSEIEIKSQTCKDLKEMFFTVPDHMKSVEKQNKDYRLKYGDYDVRLAVIEYARYMEYVVNILSQYEQKTLIKNDQIKLLKMASEPGDYIAIRVEGMNVQKDLLSVLPTHFKDYAGADIWVAILQEIIQDPLTVHLRKISSGNSVRSKNSVRKKIALNLFNDLVGWSVQLGAPQESVNQLNLMMRQSIDNYYVTILKFDSDNKSRFEAGMQPMAFIRECMTRQDSVSFGSHFLREINNFVTSSLKINVASELNTKYLHKSIIVKPVSVNNINEIRDKINMCDQVIQQAYALLKSTFAERMSTVDSPLPPAVTPTTSLVLPMQTKSLQPVLVDQIVQLNRADMENQTFLSAGIAPWNFPLNVPHFTSTQTVVLPEKFNLYSVNEADMKRLLSDETFKLYYAMAVMVAAHYINISQFGDLRLNIPILTTSLIQFFNMTEPFTENRKLFCTFINQVYGVIKSKVPDELVVNLSRYLQLCSSSNDIDSTLPFFQKVQSYYKAIADRKQ